MKNKVWVCGSLIVALMACEATHELGSDCPNDVCPRAAGRAEPACLVRQLSNSGEVDRGDGPLPDTVPELGVYVETRFADFGTRRMLWRFGKDPVLSTGEPIRACDDVPYLEEPAEDDFGANSLRADGAGEVERDGVTVVNPNPLVCLVKNAKRGPDGEFESDGWYEGEDVPAGVRPLRYTPGIGHLPNHVRVWIVRSGAESIARDGTLKETDPGVCSLPEDSAEHEEDVGRSCSLTSSAEGGYGDSEIVLETGSTRCATGACLRYRLYGDTENPCGKRESDPSCQNTRTPSEEDIANGVYCSCRCDAPDGDPGELCTCKSGFSCVPTLYDAPPGVRGSYCVKDGTINGVF